MGSYGIGPTRLVPAIIEASHDENGIIWPASIAPFDAVVINMKSGDEACDAACETIYAALNNAGFDTLYDDKDDRAGTKFATADLIGVPVQIIAGPRSVANGEVELKDRKTGARETLTIEAAINKLTASK
jgi:prolyl-tRNA synthetase